MGFAVKLTELEPQFVKHTEREGSRIDVHVDKLEDADGMFMLCPACFKKNGGPVGTHGLIVTFKDRGVPDTLGSKGSQGNATRWSVSGTGYDDLTTDPSIDVGCWHGYIRGGEIQTV